LTLTPGLRWEYFGVFHSPGAEHSLDSNFYPGSGATSLERIANGKIMRTIDAPDELRGRFYLPDYKNFAPRLGLAYDLFGDGKTVFRVGGGVFYDCWVGWELFRAYQNPPGYSFTRLHNITLTPEMVTDQYAAFPNAPVQLSKSITQDPDLHMRSAYIASWNATIERGLAATFVIGHPTSVRAAADFTRETMSTVSAAAVCWIPAASPRESLPMGSLLSAQTIRTARA
jgi:hypothetical protein